MVSKVNLGLEPGADPKARGFALGAYRIDPPEATSKTYPRSQFTSDECRWIAAEGTHTHDQHDKAIHFTDLGDHDRGVANICIDRLYLIPT